MTHLFLHFNRQASSGYGTHQPPPLAKNKKRCFIFLVFPNTLRHWFRLLRPVVSAHADLRKGFIYLFIRSAIFSDLLRFFYFLISPMNNLSIVFIVWGLYQADGRASERASICLSPDCFFSWSFGFVSIYYLVS